MKLYCGKVQKLESGHKCENPVWCPNTGWTGLKVESKKMGRMIIYIYIYINFGAAWI